MKKIQEHAYKEVLKSMVDNTRGYTEKTRSDLKTIIDVSKTSEELFQAVLIYFSVQL